MEDVTLKRMGDHLHIPEGASLRAILAFPFSPKVLKEAIRSLGLEEGQMERPLMEALEEKALAACLLPVLILADGSLEEKKGSWRPLTPESPGGPGTLRLDLYGLESAFYLREEEPLRILAGVATVQNSNVPDWRAVLGDGEGFLFRSRALEGLLQGQKILEAKSRHEAVLAAYEKEAGPGWGGLLEAFLKKSGL